MLYKTIEIWMLEKSRDFGHGLVV